MKTDITLYITDRNGEEHAIIAPTDMNLNLMEIMRLNSNFEVEGECGGMAMCATCHIYISNTENLNTPSVDELDMLDQAFFVKETSRLGCQIYITPDLNNLKFTVAPN